MGGGGGGVGGGELETKEGKTIHDWLAQNYDLVRVYKAAPEAQTKNWDYSYCIDRQFLVFRRKDAAFAQASRHAAPV